MHGKRAKPAVQYVALRLASFLILQVAALAAAQDTPSPSVADAEGDALRQEAVAGSRELLQLYGVDESHFRMLTDGVPVGADQSEALLKILYAVRRFRAVDIDRWIEAETAWRDLTVDSAASQGKIVRLSGRALRITVLRPVPEVVDRFEIDKYYRCQFLIGDDQSPATIFALSIPRAWPLDEEISQRASVLGVYLKNSAAEGLSPHPVFVAKRIAWHPESHEQGVLGDLGFDAGLFDAVKNRGSLSGASALERECFYQLLSAAGTAGTQELLRRTDDQLARLRQQLPLRIKAMRASAPLTAPQEAKLADIERMLSRANENEFDVVALFNQAESQHGRLVALKGTARRIVRVRVADADIIGRFGMDHYYEIEMFTDDSQGNPIVFCTRSLPQGMPEGENVYEPIRMAGFFFKTWAYRLPEEGERKSRKQLAPLLIGREPIWLPRPPSGSDAIAATMAGMFFILAVAGIWIGIWCYHRGDRRFHARAIAPLRDSADGKSPDDLKGVDGDVPDFSRLD